MKELMLFKDYYHLTTGDFDVYDRIRPFAVFDYFQVVAGHHALNLKLGYHDLIAQNKIWVLLRCKYDLIAHPHVADTIELTTWPLPKRRVEYERQYQIHDKNGNLLIKGTSIWCLVDINSKMILRDSLEYPGEFYNHNNYSEPLEKIVNHEVSKNDFIFTHQVRIGDLDHNHHMNNAKYSELIYNALDLHDDEVISSVDIAFINETKKGDLIDIYRKLINKGYFVTGIKKNITAFKAIVITNKI